MNGFKKSMLFLFTLGLLLVLPTSIARANNVSYKSLNGTNPSNSFEDLMFLKDELNGKTVIGVGEATHGTGSFFQFKDRLFRFLVEEMGFRAFAIEVQMSLCDEINKYVQTGEGNIESLVEHNTSVFATSELLELVKWMREYNKAAKDFEKLRFYGFDVQDGGYDYKPFDAYYKSINSGYFKEVSEIEKNNYTLFTNVLNDLERNKDRYIKASSPREFEFIEKLAYNKKLSSSMDISTRDEEMKNNIVWIQNYEKTYYNNDKIMLWAHNSHITKEDNRVYDMGNLLSKELGESYFAIGLDFYSGKFNTTDKAKKPVGLGMTKSRDGIFSGKIHNIFPDEEIMYFNIEKALNEPKLKEAFTGNVNMYNVGWQDVPSEYFLEGSPCNIKIAYDSIVYFKNTFESNYLDSNKQPNTYKMLDSEDKSNLAKENTILSKVLSIILVVLGCYMCMVIGQKAFVNKSLEKKYDKGRKIFGALIIYTIFSEIIGTAISTVEGTSSYLGVLGTFFIIFIGINAFKGKKWAKNVLFIYALSTTVMLICIMRLDLWTDVETDGISKWSIYRSIISGIATIIVLRLKCVKSYFNQINQ